VSTTSSSHSVSLHSVLSTFIQWRWITSSLLSTHSIEGPKGELVVTIHTSALRMWRVRTRPADMSHLLTMQSMCLGTCLGDVVMLVGTVDVVFGSVDLYVGVLCCSKRYSVILGAAVGIAL
jgi:NADH:ubiquinone oxidoreductase subunit D